MINIKTITFSMPDLVLLLGVAQCLYIIVYLLLRSGRLSRATIPLFYFINLAIAFALGFVKNNIPDTVIDLSILQSFLWAMQFPLCSLLIIQVAQIYKVPSIKQYWVLLLVPAAFLATKFLATQYGQDCDTAQNCHDIKSWFGLAGFVAAILSMLSIVANWPIITGLRSQKNHKERYWLILSLIVTNIAFITTMLLNIGLEHETADLEIITSLFGVVLAYLAGTSLLRIYPQAVNITSEPGKKETLSRFEISVAKQIEDLIYVQKVYHEPNYSRSDMARECEVPEGILSKVLNVHFQQSFPQLLNMHRVEDAKTLLTQLNEPMSVLATEVGFNSLATFNRVFKDVTGESPTEFKGKKPQ